MNVSRLFRLASVGVGLALLMGLLSACPPKTVPQPAPPELITTLYGLVRGGRGAGFVGGPLEGVEVVATFQGRVTPVVYTDASGSFTLDSTPLFPPGTVLDQANLTAVAPVTAEVKFTKTGYKVLVTTITFPVSRFEEFIFSLPGEGN